jgi:hypothetical protein
MLFNQIILKVFKIIKLNDVMKFIILKPAKTIPNHLDIPSLSLYLLGLYPLIRFNFLYVHIRIEKIKKRIPTKKYETKRIIGMVQTLHKTLYKENCYFAYKRYSKNSLYKVS